VANLANAISLQGLGVCTAEASFDAAQAPGAEKIA